MTFVISEIRRTIFCRGRDTIKEAVTQRLQKRVQAFLIGWKYHKIEIVILCGFLSPYIVLFQKATAHYKFGPTRFPFVDTLSMISIQSKCIYKRCFKVYLFLYMENHLWIFQPKRTHISRDMNENINKGNKKEFWFWRSVTVLHALTPYR